MKSSAALACLAILAACRREQPPAEQQPAPPAVTPPVQVSAAQFGSLRWLEGRWRGTMNDTAPFFEGYHFENDSTLRTYGFADAAARAPNDSGQIRLRGGIVTVGDSASSYVVTAIDSSSVHFEPRGTARNAFTWRRGEGGTWTATLTWRTPDGQPRERVYVMRPMR